MADNVIARKQDQWTVVSLVPDVCKTPMGAAIPPVPYPVTAELKTATGVATSVRANGKPAVVYDMSLVPTTQGDEAGAAKGIKTTPWAANATRLKRAAACGPKSN